MPGSRPTFSIAEWEKSIDDLDRNIEAAANAGKYTDKVDELRLTRSRLLEEIYAHLSPWDEVLLARWPTRPYSLDYIKALFDEYTELHGDRLVGDDQAIVGGIARFDQQPVMVIGQQKGRDIYERKLRNLGYARPQGYRKALRLMKLAEKTNLPVITFVDTPGADSNVGSEEANISEAIARNLMEMSSLATPIISVIIGEGGSGGAIGLAVADTVLMLQHATYSVIAPEGCAAILETFGRDPNRKSEAASALKLTSAGALSFGLVDEVIPEPPGAAHRSPAIAMESVRKSLASWLEKVTRIPVHTLVEQRYRKYRKMGEFLS